MINLQEMTNAQLTPIFNDLTDKPIKAWKGKKSDLILRIEALQANDDIEIEVVVPEEKLVEEAEEKPVRTIRALAIELLCATDYFEDKLKKACPIENAIKEGEPNARSVGIPYDQIIRAIKDEFPDCGTTVACLRWYAVKIRVEEFGYEDLVLPQRRPRAKPTKK